MAAELELLRAVALFAALEDDALRLLGARLEERAYDAGAAVFSEGDASHTMFVVIDGAVEIVRATAGGSFRLALVERGDWFGEIGLLAVSRRTTSARALSPVRLYELHARELRELYRHDVKSYALLTMNLARGLARKLQLAEAALAEARDG